MNFASTLTRLVQQFDEAKIQYALIGGLAMAMRGVQRSTLDADFILLADNLDAANSILHQMGYTREFHSENVSHYITKALLPARIDLLHAFRDATLGMLNRCERLHLTEDCLIPVVHTEDLIGLKVQASCNDPSREPGDWDDIRRLIRHAGSHGVQLDWELVSDYLELFNLTSRLPELQSLHEQARSI